ncbi:hypothetical protein ACFU9X_41105 [Streptomyces atratus]|uniref:hypothetical protein n=1 Tax=Streptomyces atratus TaxID=1893 RepID=UPI0036CBC650
MAHSLAPSAVHFPAPALSVAVHATSRARAADAIGAAHQWSATDPAVLAERVARDIKRLWPHLTGPEGS